MADYKRIIKNVLFVAIVPSVFVAGYYGYKAYQKYKNKNEEAESEDENREDKDEKLDVDTEKLDDKLDVKEIFGKVIPITKGQEEKIEEINKEKTA
ncbi:MAG: hypothetical protein ACW98D_16730 [Promethearchaeota archaeon]|jgi:hypothetical protein